MATVLYLHFGYSTRFFCCSVGGGFDSNHADVTIVSGSHWIMFPICGVYKHEKNNLEPQDAGPMMKPVEFI